MAKSENQRKVTNAVMTSICKKTKTRPPYKNCNLQKHFILRKPPTKLDKQNKTCSPKAYKSIIGNVQKVYLATHLVLSESVPVQHEQFQRHVVQGCVGRCGDFEDERLIKHRVQSALLYMCLLLSNTLSVV